MQLINAFIEYLDLERNYSKHTATAYQKDIQDFALFAKENRMLAIKDVGYDEIRNWIISLTNSGVSSRTINRKISALNSFYKFLLKTAVCSVNPLERHKALKVTKKIQLPFSSEELALVLDADVPKDDFVAVRDITLIKLLYSTGIRRAELINLKLSDIDFYNEQLKVLGKRNKERIIPLLPEMLTQLKTYLILRAKNTDNRDFNLFITKTGKKVYPSLVYRIINTYFSRVSTKVKKSPHMLRHTFATQLLNEGANLNGIKELLGHASLASTQVYVHNDIKKLKDAYGKAHPRNNRK